MQLTVNPLPSWDKARAIREAYQRLIDAGYEYLMPARGWRQPKHSMTTTEAQDILFLRQYEKLGGVVA